jgi:DNA repair exonuclease SbcCD nuclease subunit
MIKKVIHIADIHIRMFQRLEEYNEQLNKFIEKCREITEGLENHEVRILIAGDLLHNKNQISAEQISFASTFIRELQTIGEVRLFSGNHDLVVDNSTRMDAMTALFQTAGFDNALFIDSYLGYESGILVDDNITWALYSIFDGFRRPDIEKAREENPNNPIIGLFHGTVIGSTLDNGTIMDYGIDGNIFDGCDYVMAGDIHKRQELKRGDTVIVYPGSLIQQNFGETVTKHGFTVWDIENNTHEHIDLDSEYNLYKFEIKSIEDIENDKENLTNY